MASVPIKPWYALEEQGQAEHVPEADFPSLPPVSAVPIAELMPGYDSTEL